MPRIALVRRRQVWLPTLWGWLALVVLCAVSGLLVLRGLYPFLALTRPVSAQLLVVEGWMPADQLDQALELWRAGGYEHVITTGGPINEFVPEPQSYAERARDYLVSHGVPAAAIVAVPAPPSAQERSFLNAVMLRDWLAHSELRADALNVVSSGVHCRRSWLLHQMAFGPKYQVGIIAAAPRGYDPAAWWRTSLGAKDVLGEAISWLWTELFFHPGAPGSQEEKWGVGF
jgi:uncharacterized SAM-binding protein YcdF (DUF218 family)